jgi:hypothetical protein
MEKIIVAFVLLILGGFMIVCTKAMVRFQTWSQGAIMGAQYIPSQRTYTAIRIIGVLLIILGIIVGIGILK